MRTGAPESKLLRTFQCPGTSLRTSVNMFSLCLSNVVVFPVTHRIRESELKGQMGLHYKMITMDAFQTCPNRPCFHTSTLGHFLLLCAGSLHPLCLLQDPGSPTQSPARAPRRSEVCAPMRARPVSASVPASPALSPGPGRRRHSK